MKRHIYLFLILSSITGLYISASAQQLIPYRKGDLWGYADKQGNIQINCKYDKALTLKEGFAYVYKNKQKGIISGKEKEILPIDTWSTFSRIKNKDAFMVVNNLQQYGVVNTLGKMVVPFGKYEKMHPFNDQGIAQVTNSNLFGLVNHQGTEVLPLESYQNVYLDKKSDYLYVQKDSKCMLISPNGTLLSDKKYNYISRLDGTTDYFISSNDGLYGVLNAKGEEVLPAIYQEIYYGNEDTFIVKENTTWTSVTNQNIIISQGYDAAEPFENGFAKVIKKGNYGMIDKTGNLIIDFNRYDDIKIIEEDFFIVKREGLSGVVNEKGIEIVPPTYQKISDYKGGFAIVSKNGKYGMINTKGKEIKACNFDEIRKITDKAFRAIAFKPELLFL